MVVVGGGGFEERPTTLGNSRPPVSQSFPTQMHTVTHTQNVPTAFQLCSDQCRASCPEPWGHSWMWDVWEARGVKPDNTQLLSPPNHLTGFSSFPPFLPPPTNIFSGLLPSGEQLYEPLQLPSAVAELLE